MATINFYYRSKKEQAFLTIKLRFSIDKENFVKTAKTPIKTSSEIWEKYYELKINDAQLRKKVFELRETLSDIETFILDSFDSEHNKSKITSNEWLTNTIENFYKEDNEAPLTLVEYIDYYLEARKNEIKPHFVRKMKGLKKKLIQMQENHKHQYKIKEVNENFKNDFVSFLKSSDYSTNYIKKVFTILKQACNHARYNGLEVSPQLQKLTLKAEKVPKIYLTFSELESIEKTNFGSENLKATKDWLLISCYTGQRISDFLRFTTDMIRIENGKHLIEFTQKKTNKIMTVPLHKKVLEIIDKNKGVFPKKLLDQKYNDYLKIVCKKAKIDEKIQGRKSVNIGTVKKPVYRHKTGVYPKYDLITSHVGRRSFATNYYGKIPTTFLIYITGHSTEAMFLNYIGKSNKDLALEVSNYF
ncbi:site-specific integrase [Psychroflexus sp. CAK57W]|uniref:tyrosine-type recombinase/integrase n=1 Tax=Psychroflexus curvus TaxID=2873595 RepID=UPI001CC950C5|nr:tyrosine-type recombinase/integrase [Psychroflexus curvus]MBZ9787609.1 site-specific integrase [Psychroflexus curvus]